MEDSSATAAPIHLTDIVRHWLRIGLTSFGGPPAQIHLFRKLCVEQHDWLSAEEFEHAIATTNLLPGPAGTQLAIYCAWRARRTAGAILGGLCFIAPGLLLIIALGAAMLAAGAPDWLVGAALGASAVVPAIALRAGIDLLFPSHRRADGVNIVEWRRLLWVVVGVVGCLLLGPALVFALLACGLIELLVQRSRHRRDGGRTFSLIPVMAVAVGTIPALAWTALKVGALSFGGGFVIIPLMQADAVNRHHWMTKPAFLAAVALGQVTPGPVVQTVAVVGYAAAGVGGALLAAFIAFLPSFLIVIAGGPFFERLRTSSDAQAFLAGAGPAAIGAILGTAVLLASGIAHIWQIPLALGGAMWLLVLRKGPLAAITAAGAVGAILGIAGFPSFF